MSESFLGEIRMFAGTFAPKGWAFCKGQLLPVSQNDSLYSLLGTRYGGDGRTNFALPNLSYRIPVGTGTGPGLSPYNLGRSEGLDFVAISENDMPAHTHGLWAVSAEATSDDPAGKMLAKSSEDNSFSPYKTKATNDENAEMGQMAIETKGLSQAHYNMQPYLCINFIISLLGTYPSRT